MNNYQDLLKDTPYTTNISENRVAISSQIAAVSTEVAAITSTISDLDTKISNIITSVVAPITATANSPKKINDLFDKIIKIGLLFDKTDRFVSFETSFLTVLEETYKKTLRFGYLL